MRPSGPKECYVTETLLFTLPRTTKVYLLGLSQSKDDQNGERVASKESRHPLRKCSQVREEIATRGEENSAKSRFCCNIQRRAQATPVASEFRQGRLVSLILSVLRVALFSLSPFSSLSLSLSFIRLHITQSEDEEGVILFSDVSRQRASFRCIFARY